MYSKKTRETIFDAFSSELYYDTKLPVVIETGTDYTAFWGEMLAEKLKAKHIIEFQDEFNNRLNKNNIALFKFKFDRSELACITPKTMKIIFGSYWHIDDKNSVGLSFSCTNSVVDYHSDISDKIPSGDFIIGYIGRTNKPFVKNIVQNVSDFAKQHSDKVITFVMFGGPLIIQKDILKCLKLTNIKFFVTDFIFPLALKDLRQCDVFICGAGSAFAAYKSGVPTIHIDMYTYKPIGMRIGPKSNQVMKCLYGDKISDYLNQILIKKEIPKIDNYDFNLENENIFGSLLKHIDFLEKSEKKEIYYDITKIPLANIKHMVRKFIYYLLCPSWIYYIEAKRFIK